MAVVDGKERTSWPLIDLLKLWFDNVQNNAYSIFVVVPHNALVSVCRVAADDTVFLASKFGRVVGSNESVDLFLLHFHVLLLLLVSHDESSVGNKLVLRLGSRNSSILSSTIFLVGWVLSFDSIVIGGRRLGVTWFLSLLSLVLLEPRASLIVAWNV